MNEENKQQMKLMAGMFGSELDIRRHQLIGSAFGNVTVNAMTHF